MPKPFLHLVAERLIKLHGDQLSEICLVLPSRRASLFLRRALSDVIENQIMGPQIVVVESLASELSGLHQADTLALQFHLFNSYREVAGDGAEGFETFIKWSPRLLQDFNEIDRYRADAERLFNNLLDIKILEKWGVEEETPEMVAAYLDFWKKLYPVYLHFRKALAGKTLAYQGMMYRRAADLCEKGKLEEWMSDQGVERLYFVGFNALNESEKVILRRALETGKADAWFDVDTFYLKDEEHEAGMFLREYKKWKHFQGGDLPFERDLLRKEKRTIELIGVPRQVGMAKTMAELLSEMSSGMSGDEVTDRLALVLADEGLLMPALNSIPKEFDPVNVTMGLPLYQSGLANALEIAFDTHERALRLKTTEGRSFQIYHKDLERMLLQPFYQRLFGEDGNRKCRELLGRMRNYNAPFLSPSRLSEWIPESSHFLGLIRENSPEELIDRLAEALAAYHDEPGIPIEDKEASGRLFRVCKRLNELFAEFGLQPDMTTALHLYRQLLRDESLDFFGEPLQGLQVMGVLETRLLSFENIVMTGVNEEVLPAGKSENSFIPFDIKRGYGLPTHREKDAIYAYHFYRLLQGARHAVLLYNTETGGLNSGEASRFIEQIRREFSDFSNTTIVERVFSTSVNRDQMAQPFRLERGEFLQEVLTRRAEQGIAPSHLQLWVKDPPAFYKQVLLGQSDWEEVEEVLGDRSMGLVVHQVLEDFYRRFEGSCPGETDFAETIAQADQLILKAYEDKNGRKLEMTGRNYIVGHAMIEMTRKFLMEEQKRARRYAEAGRTWIIQGVEVRLEHTLEIPGFPPPVKIKGFADRVDRLDNDWLIIDYKTGMATAADVRVSDLGDLATNERKGKALQLFSYAWLLRKQFPEAISVIAGIFALRANGEDLITAGIEEGRFKYRNRINPDDLQTFEEVLTSILVEILSIEGHIQSRDNQSAETY